MHRTALVTCLALIAGALAGGEDPPKRIPPKLWPDAPDQAQVMAATFVGGKGSEWLVAGDFQPDGTVVLCGNVLGGVFDLGRPETVIGSDGARPGPGQAPAPDKNGKPVRPSWMQPETTGFVVRMTSDLSAILSVSRMPWTSGAITGAAVGTDGAIYITGRAGAGIAALGGGMQALSVPADATRKGGTCDATFVARLSADGTRCDWLRAAKGLSDAPTVRLRKDGAISFGAQALFSFDATGKTLGIAAVPGGINKTTSVSPVDGVIVKGGEHHWGTGREPWRCPTLNTFKPDGTFQYQLYDWGGPYVGLDNCRQVSDSAVRQVTHDRDGNVLIACWSDGGNSVITTQATDVRRGVGHRGLGITSAGAGVLSCAYLVKLEPKDWQVIGYTMWLAFVNGKPNSTWVTALGQADDGSFCFTGTSAYGLRQTSTKLTDGEPAGEHVVVLNQDLTTVRFASAVPGAGSTCVQIGNEAREGWGIGSGTVNGQTRVLFVSGADRDEDVYGTVTATPTRNAFQAQFAGGLADGYVVMVDLGKGTHATAASAATTAPPARLSAAREARNRNDKPKAPKPGEEPPSDGFTAYFAPDNVKHITVDAEFRDAKGAFWPSFLSGKPLSGQVVKQGDAAVGALAVECTTWCQPKGDQTRRVLGELIKGDVPPKLTFAISALGAVKTEAITETDKNGKAVEKVLTFQDATATLDIGGTTVAVKPKCTVRWKAGARDGTSVGVRITAYCTIKGSDLGLKTLGSEEIDVRISMTGTETQGPQPKAPKK